MKVDFLICGRRGFEVLKHHVSVFGKDSINVICSYADKNVKNDPYEDVKEFCRSYDLQCRTREEYAATDENYRFVIGWQRIFLPGAKTIVLHDSLLPKFRGFAPLVNSLIKGETAIGVTAFLANDRPDEGDILLQKKITIQYPITILEAMEQTAPLYSSIVEELYNCIAQEKPLALQKQENAEASYSLWRDFNDYRINWNTDAEEILRFIHAVGYPYHGAVSALNKREVVIRAASLVEDVRIEIRVPGKVIFIQDGAPVIVTAKGLLKIDDAAYLETGESILPLKSIRSRFE